ncbi:hypothetical protein NX801_04535 [Streptomyces sp. LP05-1]|uniref:Uncharacterized protein n=1 Tax=Streptomyces pyxinae TaxID=2970734 RepID=A0ABT2CE70_9ACTN|nr:hypothetical protein [Streptomyces sp. LP05-1]MCS0634939.1 hypothetical protein [Streptomyces sp. LP05-1]
MRFLLEIDMTDPAFGDNAAAELGRILRYWAGNLHHYPLSPGTRETVYDSAYREVGHWAVTPPAGEQGTAPATAH